MAAGGSLPRAQAAACPRSARCRSVGCPENGREEISWFLNGVIAGQREQMPIAAHELRSLLGCEREQVIVVGVGRVNRRRYGRIAGEEGGSRQPGHEGVGIRRRDEALDLRVRERPSKLGKKRRRYDQFELALLPGEQEPSWAAGGGDQRRNRDVGIEDRAQRLRPRRTSRMLRLDAHGERLIFGETVRRPDAIEQLKAEVAADRLFDDFAVALSGPRCAHLDSAQQIRVNGQSGPHLRHMCIIAS